MEIRTHYFTLEQLICASYYSMDGKRIAQSIYFTVTVEIGTKRTALLQLVAAWQRRFDFEVDTYHADLVS